MKKKIFKSILGAFVVLGLGLTITACDKNITNDNSSTTVETETKTLAVPDICRNFTEISWKAVENATGYVVSVDGKEVSTQTTTAYEVPKTTPGVFEVKVKAVTTKEGYKDSEYSSSLLVTINATYSVKVIDLDGEVLFDDEFEKTDNTLLEDLKANMSYSVDVTNYGTTVASLAGSIVDPNYYLAIYENGQYAQTGVDGLVIDNGDEFTFKVECWNTVASGYGTMDETDVLVDKIIYSYAKNQMKDYLKNTGSYTALGGFSNVAFGAADYWSFIGLNLMIQNKYDSNLFNINNVPANVKTDLEAFDTTTLSGAQFGKYYYAAKALGVDLTNGFKTAYQSYLNNLPEDYGMYSEYEYPFTLGISKNLNVTSTNLEKVIKTAYRADTTYGIDGLAWQIASLAQLTTLSTDELNAFEAKDYGNSISTALALLPFAALNVNPRDEAYQKDGKDLVEILIENYYDSENKIIKYNSEEATNSNTPQIYAALMAYKAQRDSGKAAYIFA